MRRRFQEGGDVDTDADVPEVSYGTGIGGVDPMTVLLSTLTQNMTTTPEAQEYAKGILDRIKDRISSGPEDSPVLGKMRAQSEQVRRALEAARQRLLAQNYNPGDALLAASQALGSPTRTGTIGETFGNLAGALREPLAKQGEFNRQRDTALSQLDLAESQLGGPELAAELQLEKLQQTLDSRMGEAALKELGKSTGTGKSTSVNVVPKAAEAMDRVYVKDYNAFMSGGSALAAQGLAMLKKSYNDLASGNDRLSGPVVGSIESIPYVGRGLGDVVLPQSSQVRSSIEWVVQNSLRPILGSQFTENEGLRLLERVYNPRWEEWRNARNLKYLITQLDAAYQNKVNMANYYQKHGTLYGFQGITQYKITDFYPPANLGAGPDRGTPDAGPVPTAPKKPLELGRPGAPEAQTDGFQLSRDALRSLGPDPILYKDAEERDRYHKAQEAKIKRARGGMVRRFQEGGGPVMDTEEDDVTAPPSPPDDSTLHNLKRLIELSPGSVLMDTALGGLGGFGSERALTALARQIELPWLGLKGRTANAERLVFNAATKGAKNRAQAAKDIADEIKQSSRMGVPEQLLDVDTPGIQAMTEKAITYGGRDADTTLDALRNKVEGSPARVGAQINKGLKPYPYFSHGQKLAADLYKNSDPLYQAAYAKAPGLNPDPIMDEIIATPEGQKALQYAMKFYNNTPGKTIGKVNPVSKAVMKPSLEFYDLIRDGFDQIIDREEKGGEMTQYSRKVLRPLREMYTKQLDAQAPQEYRDARAQYAGDLEVKDALRDGLNFNKLTPEELADKASRMSFHEKNAFRTGVAQNLYNLIQSSSSDNFNAAQKIIGSPKMVDSLRPFFDTPKEFEIFQTALEKEADMFRTGKGLVDRGGDLRLRAEKGTEGIGEYATKRMAGFRYAVNPIGWFLRIMRDRPRMSQAEASRVLDILQRGDPKEMDAFAKRAARLGRSRIPRFAAAAGVGAALKTMFGHDLPPEDAEAPELYPAEELPADAQ